MSIPNGVGLTDRETEVLERASHGFRNQDIASALGISEKTVQAHMRHVLLKLGVRSRTHAVAQALRTGLLAEAPRADQCLVSGAPSSAPSSGCSG